MNGQTMSNLSWPGRVVLLLLLLLLAACRSCVPAHAAEAILLLQDCGVDNVK